MRRPVAILIAVALIVIAFVVRNRIDSGSSSSASGGKPRLFCAPELESVCSKLGSDIEVTIEDPGTTADRIEKADDVNWIDGWLTPGPWAEMVVEARAREQKPAGLTPGKALARSPIGMAVWPDRLAAIQQFCSGKLTWKCFGDVAGKGEWKNAAGDPGWGTIKIGIPDPVHSATGLATIGAATVGYFGRDPNTLSSTDLDDPGFNGWLAGFAAATKGVPPLEQTLATGSSVGDAVATFESVGTRLVRTSAKKPSLTYPAPVASADVVLGTTNTDAARRLIELLTPTRLIEAGWEAPATTPSGLPSAGFLDALQETWSSAK